MPATELYQSVKSVFESENWGFVEIEGREVIQLIFEAHHTRVELHVQVFQELKAISVVSESPAGTDNPAARERLAELAMRVNAGLTIGNFEMHWDTARIVYRATNLFSTPQGDADIIRGLIHTTVAEMDRISPLITIILSSDGASLASLDIKTLMAREDLLPQLPEDEG